MEIYNKYKIEHTDGTPLKGKQYFVLRLDSDDPVESARVAKAMRAYQETPRNCKKPRNCNGCKAHYQSQWKHTCELGYEMNSRKIGSFQGVETREYYPKLGQCPKPRTLTELINAPKAWEGSAK